MKPPAHGTALHRLYLAAIWLKGAAAAVEMLAGAMVPLATRERMRELVVLITAPELAEDPDSRVANYLNLAAGNFSTDTQAFVGTYLVVHGAIKLAMVAGLLTRRMWAHPVALGLIGAFLAYQAFRFSHTHSVWLLVAMAIDLGIAWLIWREYQVRKQAT
jgi:uncharacterized membrane protein